MQTGEGDFKFIIYNFNIVTRIGHFDPETYFHDMEKLIIFRVDVTDVCV